jgi:hypothetical protein
VISTNSPRVHRIDTPPASMRGHHEGMITETTFQDQVQALENDALYYGRAVVAALNAASEGERPECAVFEHARVRHASAALLRSPQATPGDIGRIRAVQEAALHIRHIERAVAADGWRGDPRRLAAGLALALDVFVRRDLSGLRVLGRMIDVILEDPALGARARCAGLHVLAVGEAWRMAIPPVSPQGAPHIPAGVAS